MRIALGIAFIVLCSALALGIGDLAAQAQPEPKFPLSKETTYVTGPLDAEGYIDYEAALNERLGKDVAPDMNANVGFGRFSIVNYAAFLHPLSF
jgi:hypothetical protein